MDKTSRVLRMFTAGAVFNICSSLVAKSLSTRYCIQYVQSWIYKYSGHDKGEVIKQCPFNITVSYLGSI